MAGILIGGGLCYFIGGWWQPLLQVWPQACVGNDHPVFIVMSN